MLFQVRSNSSEVGQGAIEYAIAIILLVLVAAIVITIVAPLLQQALSAPGPGSEFIEALRILWKTTQS